MRTLIARQDTTEPTVLDTAGLGHDLDRVSPGDLVAGLEEAAAVYAKVAGGGRRGRWVLEI